MMAKESAWSSITGRSESLDFSLNFLLSFKAIFWNEFSNTTTAAVTGPAKQPRPASSAPASIDNPEKLDKSEKKRLSKLAESKVNSKGADIKKSSFKAFADQMDSEK